MKSKIKEILKRIAVALLARADAVVTTLLMKLVPQGNPTLESIISTFDVAASQLHAFEARHNTTIRDNAAEQARLAAVNSRLISEADRANRIKSRLTDLVS